MVDSKTVIRLRIEEDILDLDKKGGVQTTNAEANVIEHLQKRKQVVSSFSQGNKRAGVNKWNNPKHRAKDCCQNKIKKAQGNLNVDNEIELVAVVIEVNMVENPMTWWVDTGVTCHVCSDGKSFFEYKETAHEEQLFMGNSSVSKIQGHGNNLRKIN